MSKTILIAGASGYIGLFNYCLSLFKLQRVYINLKEEAYKQN